MVYLILILAILGIFDAGYIAWHRWQVKSKKDHQVLICPLGFNCEEVLESKYNRLFFGLRNEYLGLFFYLVIAILASLAIYFGQVEFLLVIYLFSIFALIASISLTYIQAVVLKNWCSWCLFSALINLALYIVSEYQFNFSDLISLLT